MKKILSRLSLVLFGFGLLSNLAFAGGIIDALGLDTMAGFDTFLRTNNITANTEVVFNVASPLGETTTLTAYSNENGVAQAKLLSPHTEMAGIYKISARAQGYVSRTNSFSVMPGEVSEVNSYISPNDQVVKAVNDRGVLTVHIEDDYGNPVSGHTVRLLSSNYGDSIISVGADSTGIDGDMVFEVSSNSTGATTYTAYDITADKVLSSRAKVAYYDSSDNLFGDFSGQYLMASSMGNGVYAVDNLQFSDVPSSVSPGEAVTFKLGAYDANDLVSADYVGNIRFSVIGDNGFYADLPEDYTYAISDAGEHVFSLSVSFQNVGTYLVEARDLSDTSIYGEYTFIVTEGNQPPDASGLTVDSPISGTYSNGVQIISGSAIPASQIKIYNKSLELTSMIVGIDGKYSYTTPTLQDGEHTIFVATVNEIGTIVEQSDPVEIVIDSSSPELTNVVLDPSGPVEAGTIVTVKVYTAEPLSQAALLFQDNIYELSVTDEGYYQTSIAAPEEMGEYGLKFVFVDQLGNETTVEQAALMNVGSVPVAEAVLGDVSGLVAYPDDHRISLSWSAPGVASNGVSNYRIYYGLSASELTAAVDTFTNATTWYLPNLKNNTPYFFAVVAVDTKGNISEHFSNIVTSTPNPIVIDVPDPIVEEGTLGGEILEEMEEDVSDSGPGVMGLMLASLIGGFFYVQFRKKSLRDCLLNDMDL